MQVKYKNFCVLQVAFFFSLRSVGIVFVFSHDPITLSQIIVESSIILAKYFPFSQLHVAGFQTQFFHVHDVFYTRIDIYHYSTIDLNYIFFHQLYSCILIIYALLMFSIRLFP